MMLPVRQVEKVQNHAPFFVATRRSHQQEEPGKPPRGGPATRELHTPTQPRLLVEPSRADRPFVSPQALSPQTQEKGGHGQEAKRRKDLPLLGIWILGIFKGIF